MALTLSLVLNVALAAIVGVWGALRWRERARSASEAPPTVLTVLSRMAEIEREFGALADTVARQARRYGRQAQAAAAAAAGEDRPENRKEALRRRLLTGR